MGVKADAGACLAPVLAWLAVRVDLFFPVLFFGKCVITVLSRLAVTGGARLCGSVTVVCWPTSRQGSTSTQPGDRRTIIEYGSALPCFHRLLTDRHCIIGTQGNRGWSPNTIAFSLACALLSVPGL